MWFLGAGTSRSAGIPTATDIIWDLKLRYYCQNENQDLIAHDINKKAVKQKIQSYMDSKGFPALWSPEEYSFYFDLIFGTDYEAQRKYILKYLSGEKISLNIGHRALAAMIGMNKTKIIFTTNFDEVIETAHAQVMGKNLSPYHLEGSYAALDALNAEQFPIYAKIHGDFRYKSIKNLSEDLRKNDEEIQKCFLAASTRYGIVVSGYSGRDDNVMSMFQQAVKQDNAFPNGIFWTVPRISNADERVQEFLRNARQNGVNAYLVETGTFDEMLTRIWRNLDSKERSLENKVKTAGIANVNIPLPDPGGQFPILRTNALPVYGLPDTCGLLKLNDSITFRDLKDKSRDKSINVVMTYTDKVLFWGDSQEVKKVFSSEEIKSIEQIKFDDTIKSISQSTHLKSFFEEALIIALCHNKPLLIRKKGKTFYAVVKYDSAGDPIFSDLRNVLHFKGRPGYITGKVNGLRDTSWAEAVSIRLEERGGCVWVMLQPDVWINPLKNRREARDFLRKRLLYRFNNKSYNLLDAWIKILLGDIGKGTTVRVSYLPKSEFEAEFEIGTRTAYSKGGG